ncbi:MAG: NAD(P)-dependent alcohol dehydrogenase [Deltaproteobacteria bacterium]|nr:NAD(P)-dependent alcohol dehydrogenase [Deltaproteobacteria bacterium]NND27820.1 NAD(P)-dependent alcohol dehydrogenase [Myxococcales bacterium]MBT8464688.1 NAD(P)-dependent alcohol dehydrogenase [Deltaproteobacteria bacterium]MBT8482431.1 NAD(P)-dependent alcohol dehydrogenase [Deltaproteobacteria bacterium]NNK06300.1 NAD(P)-dependent alcohol dehydrogenase [Myxococcales bacterium]
MKAIVQDRYGTVDALELREIDRPQVGDDEVLVRVHAAGVDPGVWHLMTGLPYLIRIAGYGFRAPKSPVRGNDVAGRVEAVGKGVNQFQAGDEVFGTADGTFAEYVSAKATNVAPKPANLSFEQAAAVPTSALTALQGLRDHGEAKPGQRVLIIGASGGIGTFAVQLAKAFGTEATGVCSTSKVDMVRSLGADHVIDYLRDDFTTTARRYDLILDMAGNRSLSTLRRALTHSGTLVIIGGEEGGRWLGGTDRQVRALLLSPFVRQRLRTFVAKESAEDLAVLKELIESGKVTPVVDKTYPLGEAAEAIRDLDEGRARGKLVLSVRPD